MARTDSSAAVTHRRESEPENWAVVRDKLAAVIRELPQSHPEVGAAVGRYGP